MPPITRRSQPSQPSPGRRESAAPAPSSRRPPGLLGPSDPSRSASSSSLPSRSENAVAPPSGIRNSTASTSFSSRPQTMGEGIPGFRTSFDVSGKGGGAFKPISETFQVNPASGTMSFSLPIRVSPSRGGYGPELTLAYDSGSGNGPFGFGWGVSLPSISQKTTRGIPRYLDAEDELVMSGADMVRKLNADGTAEHRIESGVWGEFDVAVYRPRVDNGSTRIERWASKTDPSDVHWRTISSSNETAIFGDSDDSRIADTKPGERRRVFSWLLSRSYDALGNCIEYTYKSEDAKGIANPDGAMPAWEANRPQEARARQRYLKRVKYGNRIPNRDLDTWAASPSKWPQDWMFELVLDYGEHDQVCPGTAESRDWLVRKDAFSQGSAGFEVRTYRLCRRFLMFHHFPDKIKSPETLVHSVSMQYDESPQRTVLDTLSMSGHSLNKDGSYWSENMPPWSFQYTAVTEPSKLAALEANVVNLLDLPNSKSKVSEWLDLDGSGMPGLLMTSHDGTFLYQRNRGLGLPDGEPQFFAPVALAQQPNLMGGTFQDLDHNGSLNYVLRDSQNALQGYFERGESDTWSSFSTFTETPGGDSWQDTLNIDLTGDGLADTLCLADDSQMLVWQQNLGKKGLSGYKRIQGTDPKSQPRLMQTDDTQTHIADMTGSGMADLVQISATSIRYWPNMGHGSFGAAVEMGNPPILSAKENFDNARVQLVDVDGSGTTDLIYLSPSGGASLYYNLSGNSWSEPIFIPNLPLTATPSSVFTLDILGKGTGCLCWADTSNGSSRIRYLDLMGDTKPHLLKSYSNGLGASTSIAYSPSTKFYVDDERDGRPWSTRLPFPTQCVSCVEVQDAITGNSRATHYIYHNGAYDPLERHFSGFEMVEEFRSEKLVVGDEETYEPPVAHTKLWFSVGLALEVDKSRFLTKPVVSSRLEEGDSGDDPTERLQALRGVGLRTEKYSQDGTDKAGIPFLIEELSYDVKLLQPRGLNKYSVVQVNSRETLSKQYERHTQDPRVTHEVILRTNPYGDVEEKLKIVYPRTGETAFTDVNENQKAGSMAFTQTWYTDEVVEQYDFRKPLMWRQQEHEVLKFPFIKEETLSVEAARKYDFQGLPTSYGAATWKSLRNETRAFFKDSCLEKRLGEGKLQTHSVLDQTYNLVYTPEILEKVALGLKNCKIPDSVGDLLNKGKYVKLKDSDSWWAPSSRVCFCRPSKTAAAPVEELKSARQSFYTPSFFVDVFGNVSRIKMDEDFLLAKEIEDAVGNVSLFENNYEHLQPVKITDSNMNAVQIMLDPLGHQIAMAALGKGRGNEGDVGSVEDLVLRIAREDIDSILLDPTGEVGRRVLGNAESRTIHCIDRYCLWRTQKDTEGEKKSTAPRSTIPQPAFTLTMTRNLPSRKSSNPDILVLVSYMNGLGTEFQELHLHDPTAFEKKWLVTGLAIPDSHDHVVCTYQPRFATSPAPISAAMMKTPAAFEFWDAMNRSVASLAAGGTWSKNVYTPWEIVEHSAGDMILHSRPQDDPVVGQFFTRISTSRYAQSWYDKRIVGEPQEKRAAEKSAIYAGAPLTTHLGSCGLPVRTVRVAGGETYTRRSAYDVNGNRIRDFDSYDRLVEKMTYDKLNRELQSSGMDQGESWTLQDALGGELLSWNCRGNSFLTRYDGLRREIEKLVATDAGAEPKLVTRITYGEKCLDATTLNLKNQVWQVEDQSGVHTSTRFDFRGHRLEKIFQATQEYKNVVDWNVDNVLEETVYSHTYLYDIFGQVLEERDPQGNRTRRRFTRHGQVEAVDFSCSTDTDWKPHLKSTVFAADGLPETMTYGNNAVTSFYYDEKSRYLLSQRTTRPSRGTREVLEELIHVYDCAGRRIFTRDDSEQVKYFRESRIKPEWDYTYDVVGRLVSATGRAQLSTKPDNPNQLKPYGAMSGLSQTRGVTDANMLYEYVESYEYDREGNIHQMKHAAPGIKGLNGWTRTYYYEEQSLLSGDPKIKSNRLSRTTIGDEVEGKYAYEGSAGLSGCMTTLPQFTELGWNANNMLSFSSTQYVEDGTPERTYYVYDHAGNRTRKVTESSARPGEAARKKTNTLFFGGVELQTRSNGSSLWTVCVKGDDILAVVEFSSARQQPLMRIRIGDGIELDDKAQMVSYEEYSPFGSIVYSAVYSDVEAPRKYRFAKYEHDHETGLYHCGLRYYCPWLGRWTSPDPLGDVDGPNLYNYVGNDPINYNDSTGTCRAIAGFLKKCFGKKDSPSREQVVPAQETRPLPYVQVVPVDYRTQPYIPRNNQRAPPPIHEFRLNQNITTAQVGQGERTLRSLKINNDLIKHHVGELFNNLGAPRPGVPVQQNPRLLLLDKDEIHRFRSMKQDPLSDRKTKVEDLRTKLVNLQHDLADLRNQNYAQNQQVRLPNKGMAAVRQTSSIVGDSLRIIQNENMNMLDDTRDLLKLPAWKELQSQSDNIYNNSFDNLKKDSDKPENLQSNIGPRRLNP